MYLWVYTTLLILLLPVLARMQHAGLSLRARATVRSASGGSR